VFLALSVEVTDAFPCQLVSIQGRLCLKLNLAGPYRYFTRPDDVLLVLTENLQFISKACESVMLNVETLEEELVKAPQKELHYCPPVVNGVQSIVALNAFCVGGLR
jgi:hypothetical protein